MRERVARKAKERAVEHLHEITTNRLNRSVTKTKTKKQTQPIENDENSRSYIDSDDSGDEYIKTPRGKTQNSKSTTVTSAKKSSKTNKLAKPQAQNELNEDLNSLFQQIFQSKTPIELIIDEWIELYQKKKEQALLDLMHLIIRSSGCKGRLTSDLFKSNDYADVIDALVEEFDAEVVSADTTTPQAIADYPLINNHNQYKRFKMNFCDFLHELIQKCQYSIIYDQFMINNLISLLIGLSDSQVRAFRHTATLAVLKIITSLIDVLIALETNKSNTKKQLDNEIKKTSAKRANDRIELLNKKFKEFNENETDINSYLDYMFNGVFIHRYRDVNSDIRGICIYELGIWMNKYPIKYLNDSCLKYIGWTLYDKHPDCRIKCINALNPLYSNVDLESKLELFTQRFKQRIIEMCLDRDSDVAVKAIKLITSKLSSMVLEFKLS